MSWSPGGIKSLRFYNYYEHSVQVGNSIIFIACRNLNCNIMKSSLSLICYLKLTFNMDNYVRC